MENLWLSFKELYTNENDAKNAFESACMNMLELYYANQKLEPFRQNFVNTINTSDEANETPRIILHCKFFFDGLNNSRKGQIRKAFNSSFDVFKTNQIPVSDWILCIPVNLSPEEKNWWDSWSTRTSIDNKINIELFDGENLITLLKKYFLYDNWFAQAHELSLEKSASFNSNSDENLAPELSETDVNPMLKKSMEDGIITLEETISESKSVEGASKEEVIQLEELLKHAQDFENTKEHAKAMELYAYAEQWFADSVEQKDSILVLKEYCKNKINFNAKLKDAELLYAAKDYKTALNTFEDAIFMDSTDKEALQSYNECYGDLLITQKSFSIAKQAYCKASEILPASNRLNNKISFADSMAKASGYFVNKPMSFVNPLISPFYLYKASSLNIENDDLKPNPKKAKITVALTSVLFLVIIVSAGFGIFSLIQNSLMKWPKKALTGFEYEMDKGNTYLSLITPSTVQYYDSAIISFRKALKYEPANAEAASKMLKLQEEKNNYVKLAQENIKTDSARFFVSLRRPTEGLRLFKYKYEPENSHKGKYGYVDANMNIVVPPLFDFSYKKLNMNGEVFTDGKAKVCLVVNKKDTLFFTIDKTGEILYEN